jgi:hypothetical protein
MQSVTVDTADADAMQPKHQDLSHRRKTMFKMLKLAAKFFDAMC